jgi:hypothetical protein
MPWHGAEKVKTPPATARRTLAGFTSPTIRDMDHPRKTRRPAAGEVVFTPGRANSWAKVFQARNEI